MNGRRLAVLLATVVTGACMFGRTAATYPPARTPSGLQTTVYTTRSALTGELLAATDTSLIIVSEPGAPCPVRCVVLVPYAAILLAEFPSLRSANFDPPGPRAHDMRNLRLHSRYPQGISPELMARLLEAYGQTALEVIGS